MQNPSSVPLIERKREREREKERGARDREREREREGERDDLLNTHICDYIYIYDIL